MQKILMSQMSKGRAIVTGQTMKILRSKSNLNMGSVKLFSYNNNGFPI